MIILLFGVSNVGKTTVGRILAEKLKIPFFDLDEEIKKHYNITLEEFVHVGTIKERDKKRGKIISELVNEGSNKVIAISPMSNRVYFEDMLKNKQVVAIELRDTVMNIFDRLVFSDENDQIYRNDDYKNAHKNYYLNDIRDDLIWYGNVYSNIKNKYDIKNDKPESVANGIVEKFDLQKSIK